MKQEKTKHFSSETIRSFVLWSADEFEGCLKPILFLSSLSSPATFKTKSKKKKKEIKIKQQRLKDMKGPLKVPGPGLHRFVCDWSIFQYDSPETSWKREKKKIAKPTKEDSPLFSFFFHFLPHLKPMKTSSRTALMAKNNKNKRPFFRFSFCFLIVSNLIFY